MCINGYKKGFTLIEVTLSIAIIAISGGVLALLINSIVDSWQFTQNRLELQKASTDIMNELIQGGFEATGVRDAVDFLSCGAESVIFLPLWVDETHKPDPVGNKFQKFTLNRQFKAGSSIPLAQYKKPETDEWLTASVKFDYGAGKDPSRLDDVVQVLDPVPFGSKLKFTFTPDPDADPDTRKSFTWNEKDSHIYKAYKGSTDDILRTMPQVKTEVLRFIYYDNMNQAIPMKTSYLSAEQVKRVTAVKVYLLLARKGDKREAVSYTNVRSAQGVGVSIMEGTVMPIPGSLRIKALSIGNFFGPKRDGIVRLVAKPEDTKYWAIQLKIVPDTASKERLKVERFQIESPPGRVLTSSFINQTFMADEFVNLLVLDRTGIYDYNDDDGVDDFYRTNEDTVLLEVERLDFDGASLFVRP